MQLSKREKASGKSSSVSKGWQKRTEKDSLGLLNGLAEATKGKMGESSVELLGRVEKVHEERGL